MPVINVVTMRMRKIPTLLVMLRESSFPDKLLKTGRNRSTMQTAKIREKKDKNKEVREEAADAINSIEGK